MSRSSGGMLVPDQQIIINSNMDWAQRRSSGAPTTTYSVDTSYVADRFYVLPAGAAFGAGGVVIDGTSARMPANARQNLKLTGAASMTTVEIGQIISMTKYATYRQPLTFSCSIYNSTGASLTPTLLVGTPTTGDQQGARTWTNRLTQALAPCQAGAVTKVSSTFDPSVVGTFTSEIVNGLRVRLQLPSGSMTAGKDVSISQFSLKPSACSPLYVPPDPRDELVRCQAYLEVIASGTAKDIATLYAVGATRAYGTYPFKASKIITPGTITVSSSAHFAVYTSGFTTVALGGNSFACQDTERLVLDTGSTVSGLALGQASLLTTASASAFLAANAELG